ncbi:MAG: HAMP domain-containing sensor histidine kinase, partial [Alkalibacterium sp.]
MTFAYNLSEDIEIADNGEVILSEQDQELVILNEAWLQILDNEGYVTQSYNTPDYAKEHYSPMEISSMRFPGYHPGYYYEVGRTTDDINFLVAVPEGSWERYTFEIDRNMITQFGQIMTILAAVIFLIMGFIFSRRIAKPVTQIIAGVEELSEGHYKAGYKEKGLYKSVFISLNQLAKRLKTSESEREKTKEQREKWISNISHDLKTPLSSIKGYSEILGNAEYDLSPGEIRDYSETIREKSLYMEDMIEDLRLNERLMHAGISLNKKIGNLTSFIREIIIDTLNHPEYSERTIAFQPAEEDITFSFDRELLKRCIENL